MPSRKRNKGRERKLKKEAKIVASSKWRMWAGRPLGVESDKLCNHGCTTLPPQEHAVSSFMNAFESLSDENGDVYTVMEKASKCCPGVWKDDEQRQTTISILLRMGTNLILSEAVDNDYEAALGIARAILLLEFYDGADGCLRAAVLGSVYINGACGQRDVLKFYSKRLPCSCLKEVYKQARKSLPKVGACVHCKQETDRSNLMTCGHCRVPFYCSRQCQVSDWEPNHSKFCGSYADARKRQEACAKEKSQSMGE